VKLLKIEAFQTGLKFLCRLGTGCEPAILVDFADGSSRGKKVKFSSCLTAYKTPA
jgi:hypothetical protein